MSESNIIVFPARAKPAAPVDHNAVRLAQMSRALELMKEIQADLEALRKTLKSDVFPSG